MKTSSRQIADDFGWWRECQPNTFYKSDDELARSLMFYCRDKEKLAEYQDRLIQFGAEAASILNEAAEISNQPENLPTLSEGHDEPVRYHQSYHEIGMRLYRTGVMKLFSRPSHNVLGMGFLHLLSMNGESGHACPFACTAGVIKVLSAVGSPDQQKRYLPHLLETDYRKVYHGAQYLTESHGGSDVGANRTIAEKDAGSENSWFITGEKWFCSNVTAHLAVLTARPLGAPEGTRGLGLFLLLQRSQTGKANGIEIIRLKDKLGTKSLATAEIVLKRAGAEALGPIDRGFQNMMRHVIDTSRLSNCMFASGAARRACLTANLFVDHRMAFGKRVGEFPLVHHTLEFMKAKSLAIMSGCFCLTRMLDDLESDSGDRVSARLYRTLLNLSKYRTSVMAREIVLAGIECLGGNGTIESFSIMPRLLRDCVIYESWEGPHNVLIAQTFRDFRKDSLVDCAFSYLESTFAAIGASEISDVTAGAIDLLKALRIQMTKELDGDADEPSWRFRSAAGTFGNLFFLSQMCATAEWEKQSDLKPKNANAIPTFWNYIRYYEDSVLNPDFGN